MLKQPTTGTPSSAPGKIVTLPATGTNTSSSAGGGSPGKIVTLPAGTVGKAGSSDDLKTKGRADDLRVTPQQQFPANKRNPGAFKFNANPSGGSRPQGTAKMSGSFSANSTSRVATSQPRGPVQSMGGGHGGFMR
jgi:hypothetical protein